MRKLEIFITGLLLLTLMVSCVSFDELKASNVNLENVDHADIETLRELAISLGIDPEGLSLEELQNLKLDDIQDPWATPEYVDPNTAAEQEAFGADEEVAVQPSEKGMTGFATSPTFDMYATTPTVLNTVTPDQPGAEWTTPDQLLPQNVQTEENSETLEQSSDSVTISGVQTLSSISGESEWDMLSEYDKFIADLGEDVKEATTVSTTTFVPPEEEPATLDVIDENDSEIQWEEIPTTAELENAEEDQNAQDANVSTEQTKTEPNEEHFFGKIGKFFKRVGYWFKKLFGKQES